MRYSVCMERGLLLVTGLAIFTAGFTNVEGEGSYYLGICYGMQGDNLPQPKEFLHLYYRNKLAMRLYDPNPTTLDALRWTAIDVIVNVPNSMLQILASNPAEATAWLQLNILPYRSDVFFKYIVVGNEAIPGEHAPYVLPAMKNLNNSISDVGLFSWIRVTTAVGMSVLGKSHPPSAATFSVGTMEYMRPIVQFLNTPTTGLLLVNVYPYFAYAANPKYISLEYALFTAPGIVVQDGQFGYQNLFHAMTDAFFWALEKVGGSRISILVSETGWPTAGGLAATTGNAQLYVSNLIKQAGLGTPKKRSARLYIYISSLFDENLKWPHGVANHFGLFYPNQQPVYPINFTG